MANYNFPNNFSSGVNMNNTNLANNLNTMNPSLTAQPQMAPMPQQQQLFLQSQGNLYMINNPLEISNVPVGTGISVAISLSEGLMYLKSMQNGIPMVIGYKLNPIENITSQTSTDDSKNEQGLNQETSEILEQYNKRLQKIEQFLSVHNSNNNTNNTNTREGEKLQWQI